MTVPRHPDFVDQSDRLTKRVRDLETGVTKPPNKVGGYGRNTNWFEVSLRTSMKASSDTRVFYRVRSDYVFFKTVGTGILLPAASKTLALFRVGDYARTAHTMRFCDQAMSITLAVHPDGNVFYEWGALGPFTLSGVGFPVG